VTVSGTLDGGSPGFFDLGRTNGAVSRPVTFTAATYVSPRFFQRLEGVAPACA
jgi:hypothetical protein